MITSSAVLDLAAVLSALFEVNFLGGSLSDAFVGAVLVIFGGGNGVDDDFMLGAFADEFCTEFCMVSSWGWGGLQ